MNEEQITNIVNNQKAFFNTGKTLDINFRKNMLKKLKGCIIKNENMLEMAMKKDLGKSEVEGFLCDIGPSIVEINEMIKGLNKWSKSETHFSGILCWPSIITKVHKMPYGNCLIISPFNFPMILTFGVLAACISGGNTAVIKCSSKSNECTKTIKHIICETFSQDYISVIDGGHDIADICLNMRFDKIFYTGSPNIGKYVMEKASKNLTPVALELGGETGNWCIIRKDANIKDAARKIAFFKACNSGQICININQIAVASEIADQFIKELIKAFKKQLGENASGNEEYPKLITKSAYDKCECLATQHKSRIVFGGFGNPNNQKFNPTILYPISKNDDIVQKELFNPMLPIVPYDDNNVDEILETIQSREHPLAMYIFTSDVKWAKKVMGKMQYGGGCINEVCLHMMVKGVPFNGTGHSGMGAYHGKWGFDEFTHPSTVLIGKQHFNLPLREHPYGNKNGIKFKIIKRLLK